MTQTALVGFGPANLGLLIAAIRRGGLPQLARGGLTIIEAGERLGRGTIGEYRISANSLASVFLECVDDARLGSILDPVKSYPTVARFRSSPGAAPRLEDVGDTLEVMADAVISYLSTQIDLTILTATRATSWERRDGHHVFHVAGPSGPLRVVAETAFVNCGGRSRVTAAEDYIPAETVVSSHDLLRMDDQALTLLLDRPDGGSARVAILGSSHSAISSAIRISSAMSTGDIQVFGREPIRLFYASKSEARADGYEFHPERDVCPLSGRVNRFGGLRYDAHVAVRTVWRTGRIVPGGPVVTLRVDERPVEAARRGGPYSLAVIATGYDADGPCRPAPRSHADGRVRDETGRVVPGLYAFGLGSGLVPSERIGGEPAFRGRLDGFWLYQYDVGDAVLEAYAADQQVWQPSQAFR